MQIFFVKWQTCKAEDFFFNSIKKFSHHFFFFSFWRNPSLSADGTWSTTYWPLHDPIKREVLELNANVSRVLNGHRVKKCAFWKKFLPRLLTLSKFQISFKISRKFNLLFNFSWKSTTMWKWKLLRWWKFSSHGWCSQLDIIFDFGCCTLPSSKLGAIAAALLNYEQVT